MHESLTRCDRTKILPHTIFRHCMLITLLSVRCRPSDTVADLKEALRTLVPRFAGLTNEVMRLVVHGKEMVPDSMTLKSLDAENEDAIMFVHRVRGGGYGPGPSVGLSAPDISDETLKKKSELNVVDTSSMEQYEYVDQGLNIQYQCPNAACKTRHKQLAYKHYGLGEFDMMEALEFRCLGAGCGRWITADDVKEIMFANQCKYKWTGKKSGSEETLRGEGVVRDWGQAVSWAETESRGDKGRAVVARLMVTVEKYDPRIRV
eukprot:EC800183.1.p1 GENE.EC800183.1~~EC800183.1.p1  ORF type:complete len:262 (+),score=46.65 EC800183.1:115-900(+)